MQQRVTLENLAAFARQFWEELGPARVVLFHGAMGSGKTTTIAALCRAKGVRDAVSSPTFSIINEYQYEEHGVLKKLFHIDLYRLKSEAEVVQAGVEDTLYSGAVCFVEWPEIAPQIFDQSVVHVVVEPLSDTERLLKVLPDGMFRNAVQLQQS